MILADIGRDHVFAGWFDARWARVIVGGEIKKKGAWSQKAPF